METSSFFPKNQNKRNRSRPSKVYQFVCTNKACAEKEHGAFQIEIPIEAVMDSKNMAMPFCRRCGKTMNIQQNPL